MKLSQVVLFTLASLPLAMASAIGQNTQSGATSAAPASPDTSVPGAVAPPATPAPQSGILQGSKTEAAKMGTVTAVDAEFVRKAAEGGMAEVAAGKLAERSDDQRVKEFGQKMVEDHSRMGNDLATVAQTKGVSMPTGLGAGETAKVDKLGGLTGREFDKAYVVEMISDHEEAIALFEAEANGGQDADIKQYAQEALPTLQQHLSMIRKISDTTAGK